MPNGHSAIIFINASPLYYIVNQVSCHSEAKPKNLLRQPLPMTVWEDSSLRYRSVQNDIWKYQGISLLENLVLDKVFVWLYNQNTSGHHMTL